MRVALEERVQRLPAVIRSEQHAERPQPRRRDDLTVRQDDPAGVCEIEPCPHRVAVPGEAPVVPLRGIPHFLVRQGVDLVGAAPDGAEPAGDVHLVERPRMNRQIAKDRESSERLPEHAPRHRPETLADRLGILHDRVGAQVRHVLCDRLVAAGEIGVTERRGRAGPPLVEQHDPIVRESPVEPRRPRRCGEGVRRLEAGATLQEQQVGQVLAALAGDDRGVHVDRARVGVVAPDERHGDRVVVDAESEDAARGDGHLPSLGIRVLSRVGR